MVSYLPIITLLVPFVGGFASYFLNDKYYGLKKPAVILTTVLTSVLTWISVWLCREQQITVFHFTDRLRITLKIDGLGMFFALLVSVLWIFAVIYAFAYMKGKKHLNMFFAFYTATYGAVLGVAMSGDLLTMYFFYELLTLLTLPLVIQPMTKKAIRAGRKYLYLSLGGSAFAFIGLVLLLHNGGNHVFAQGGSYFSQLEGNDLLGYFFTFLGFGVKAAIFPLHIWLPSASVAPTPVTALLHAVAVVKSGAFAIIRLTYFCYGQAAIKDTWVQAATLIIASVTIIYGSTMALKERHFKRRLAYSTVANISYIIFGTMLLTKEGLVAALLHFLFHSLTKLIAFVCAGNVMEETEREYIFQLDGLGRKMPVTFGLFAVAALSLTGIPPLACFVSKWELCMAAVQKGDWVSMFGMAALLLSAFLTAIYMLTVCVRAFFAKGESTESVKEANWQMTWVFVPIAIAIIIAFPVFGNQISDWITNIASSAF